MYVKETKKDRNMNREEELLKLKYGKKSPFKVPEGYFDHFTSELMTKLPEREAREIVMQPSIWHRYRPALWVAASACAAIFSVGIYLHHENSEVRPVAVNTEQVSTGYSAFDEAADYTMMDNTDMYAYLSSEGSNN